MLESWSPQGVYVWDLVAAVNATDPDLCAGVLLSVDVLVAPGPDQGQTVITDDPPNATVCLDPDPEQIREFAAAYFGR
jgi:inosine-uridine nucleoside N-ribohydrolase